MKKIGLIVGSVRKASYNKKVAEVIKDLLSEKFEVEFIEIANLPFYNEEFDEDPANLPSVVTEFRNKVKAQDGIIFVTPEYNRSVPGVLKNAFDIGSRPYMDQAWINKHAAVVSASTGGFGAMRANYELRTSMFFSNMRIMGQPETMLANVKDNFDENGNATERTIEFLKKFTDAFTQFIGE